MVAAQEADVLGVAPPRTGQTEIGLIFVDTMRVPGILDTMNHTASPGAAVFRVDGRTYRLDAFGDPADSTFWIQFGDETNEIETYGAGRYIRIDAPTEDDAMVIDFNKSYNPPCVVTPYATRPLPPR